MEIFPTGSKFGKEKEDYMFIDDANVATRNMSIDGESKKP